MILSCSEVCRLHPHQLAVESHCKDSLSGKQNCSGEQGRSSASPPWVHPRWLQEERGKVIDELLLAVSSGTE